jgi:hypothetical protein
MKQKEFEVWLTNREMDSGTISSRVSNVNRVCEFEGDVDKHFDSDCGKIIIEKLSYSTSDQHNALPPRHSIPIEGELRNGSATLKSAVKLYFLVREEFDNGIIINEKTKIRNKNLSTRSKGKRDWPEWNQPEEEDVYELAQIVCRYIRFLTPEIIGSIVANNQKNMSGWEMKLSECGIDTSLYLWDGASCCFPGIRRHAGGKEINSHRMRTNTEKQKFQDAIKIDDNDFPKQIWSFIFRGQQFSKYGPKNYSLAHLIDHKVSGNRMTAELFFESEYLKPYYGLYTCASNSVYIPNSLLKPTDFNNRSRNLLFRKAESLYGSCCNILPPGISIPRTTDERWGVDKFTWADCVGSVDNVNLFLEYRNRKMEELLLYNI